MRHSTWLFITIPFMIPNFIGAQDTAPHDLAQLIEDLHSDEVPGNAEAALQQLMQIRDDSVLAALDEAMSSDDAQQRFFAARVVQTRRGNRTEELLDRAGAILLDNLRADLSPANATLALEAFSQLRPSPSTTRALMHALSSEDRQLRFNAALALGNNWSRSRDPQVLEVLFENLSSDGQRGNAADAWLVIEGTYFLLPPEIIEMCVRDLDSEDPQRRFYAAQVLAGRHERHPSERLALMLIDHMRSDGQPRSADRAVMAISRLRPELTPPLRERLEAALHSDDHQQAFCAARVLAVMNDSPTPLRAWRILADHFHSRHHIETGLQAYSAFRHAPSPLTAGAIDTLLNHLDSPDQRQRLLCGMVLMQMCGSEEIPPHPSLASVAVEGLAHERVANGLHGLGGSEVEFGIDWVFNPSLRLLVERPKFATAELEQALDSPDQSQTHIAACILATTGRTDRLDRITEILISNMRDDNVALNARRSCFALSHLSAESIPLLADTSEQASDPQVRSLLRVAIANITTPPTDVHSLRKRCHLPDIAWPQ